eukprot:TRINITY_DN7991_c0_g1_i1.p1 TRINITY_DN7991_c0_g1~~TRINITY_DN7991_c0_g1_i1.p1  ORF type:complete len:634 (+),score=120.40 TRINITY_DN7991_c0_g1_i1:88-1989(+)
MEDLLEFLLGDFSMLSTLCLVAPYKDSANLADSLPPIVEEIGDFSHFMQSIVDIEILHTHQENTIFRGNNAITKILGAFTRKVGADYLEKVVVPHISRIHPEDVYVELDPNMLQADENAQKSVQTLTQICRNLMDSIFKSMEQCPMHMRVIGRHIELSVHKKFGGELGRCGLAGYFFLRFISPHLLQPIPDKKSTKRSQRTMTLVSKVIQTLANGADFSIKDKYLASMHPFLEEYTPLLNSFLKSFIDLGSPTVGLSRERRSTVRITDEKKDPINIPLFLSEKVFTINTLLLEHFDLLKKTMSKELVYSPEQILENLHKLESLKGLMDATREPSQSLHMSEDLENGDGKKQLAKRNKRSKSQNNETSPASTKLSLSLSLTKRGQMDSGSNIASSTISIANPKMLSPPKAEKKSKIPFLGGFPSASDVMGNTNTKKKKMRDALKDWYGEDWQKVTKDKDKDKDPTAGTAAVKNKRASMILFGKMTSANSLHEAHVSDQKAICTAALSPRGKLGIAPEDVEWVVNFNEKVDSGSDAPMPVVITRFEAPAAGQLANHEEPHPLGNIEIKRLAEQKGWSPPPFRKQLVSNTVRPLERVSRGAHIGPSQPDPSMGISAETYHCNPVVSVAKSLVTKNN